MILLDTHVLVWVMSDSHHLGQRFRDNITASWAEGTVAVSAIVFWEIALQQAKGRLGTVLPSRLLRNTLRVNGLYVEPVDDEIAIRAVELGEDGFHPDPADRFIASTAIVGGYRLATADGNIVRWGQRHQGLSIVDPRR